MCIIYFPVTLPCREDEGVENVENKLNCSRSVSNLQSGRNPSLSVVWTRLGTSERTLGGESVGISVISCKQSPSCPCQDFFILCTSVAYVIS